VKLLRTKVWPWFDILSLKWCAFLFGMIAGAYLPYFFRKYTWVILGLAIILAIKPSITYFGDKE